MRLLNLGAGAVRPGPPFVNVDTLDEVLYNLGADALAALINLRKETNYQEYDLSQMPWPWEDESADGILCSHFCEHWDAQTTVKMMRECLRILKPGGVLRVSVPNGSYFRSVYPEDRRENWMKLFGEGNDGSSNTSYMSVALFFEQHLQIYSEDTLWCQMVQAGFLPDNVYRTIALGYSRDTEAARALAEHDNRAPFSLFAEAFKVTKAD